jgi:hypothetical protein
MLVAAALLVVIGGLAAPGLVRLWRTYEFRAACANNMRVVWNGLQGYSDVNRGEFPPIARDGPRSVAGIFVPVLHDAEVLSPDANLVCPAEQGRTRPLRHRLKQLETLFDNQPEEYARAACELAGSYAYSLGYEEGGDVKQVRRDSGDGLPILADRLPCGVEGNSPNHGGTGQNVLYVGGNVRWTTQRTCGVNGDDIYLNRNREVHAGLDRDDTVLGCSESSPAGH